jgi:DNA-binding NarL/FixJ family response regulator/class 3 adenylate cyclase
VTTSTILFTGIDATAARRADGESASERRLHLDVIRRIVADFGGRDITTIDDGVMALFDSTYAAVRAAIAVQQQTAHRRAGDSRPGGVRVGINVGELIGDLEGDEVFGAAVVVARRLRDAAAPGQITASEIVEHLLRRRLDITFRSIGEVEGVGSSESERAFEVTWEPLPERAQARVVVADDAGLLRAGIVNLLRSTGFDVVAEAGDFDGLIDAVSRHRPDLLITDIRMPPTNGDEGIRAALALRSSQPDLAVLVLSQYVDVQAAIALLDSAGAGVGYLLKERVTEVAEFIDAARQVLAGTPVIDPTVAQRMMGRRSVDEALNRLSAREREVLSQMATGASNRTIAESLTVSAKTVETHVSSILTKLDLVDVGDGNRRVQAVLRFLEATR